VRLAVAGTLACRSRRATPVVVLAIEGTTVRRSDFRKEAGMYSGGIAPHAPLGELFPLREGE